MYRNDKIESVQLRCRYACRHEMRHDLKTCCSLQQRREGGALR